MGDGRYAAIRNLFEVYVLSHHERCCKPEPAIYRAQRSWLVSAPHGIFFVDDRPENVEGALRAGLDAVPFEGAAQLAEALRAAD